MARTKPGIEVDLARVAAAREALLAEIERTATLKHIDHAYMRYVLALAGENRVQAAAILEIDRRTIQRWLASPARRRRFGPPTSLG